MIEFILLVYFGTSVWVLFDARQLGAGGGRLKSPTFDMGPTGWFFSCLLLWIIAFPVYLSKRQEYKAHPTTIPDAVASRVGEDIPAQIERLAELKTKGFISEAEFDSKKSDLLSRM